jgi:hypothetical protein
MLSRISIDSFVYAAVNRQVCLTIAVEIESSDSNAALDWLFEDGGGDRLALRNDLARKPNVDGKHLHVISAP